MVLELISVSCIRNSLHLWLGQLAFWAGKGTTSALWAAPPEAERPNDEYSK